MIKIVDSAGVEHKIFPENVCSLGLFQKNLIVNAMYIMMTSESEAKKAHDIILKATSNSVILTMFGYVKDISTDMANLVEAVGIFRKFGNIDDKFAELNPILKRMNDNLDSMSKALVSSDSGGIKIDVMNGNIEK